MKRFDKIKVRLRQLTFATARFPLTVAFFVVAMAINTVVITKGNDRIEIIFTLMVGALLSAVLQLVYERFFHQKSFRLILMGTAALLTMGYYIINIGAPKSSPEIGIRTIVTVFALFLSFILVPTIKSRISFNESFKISFDSLIIALFFSGVIFLGLSFIFIAIDKLLVSIDYRLYSYTANIIYLLFGPLYFLSLIPIYPRNSNKEKSPFVIEREIEMIKQAAACPRLVEILISYIIIPLLAVFTLVLLAYIMVNIGSNFWNDNLLESMLISYSIGIILICILASELENKFAGLFRTIFPKILMPIVLLQIASSVITMSQIGLTLTRYYAILYGIFAVIAGLILSIMPLWRNGIIAALLIVFSLISVVPPFDAFSLSRSNQKNLLEKVLIQNNMLKNNQIKPNPVISDHDKQVIIKTVSYLEMMDYTTDLKWLPADFSSYKDFAPTFGFNEDNLSEHTSQSLRLSLEEQTAIDISEYDRFIPTNISIINKQKEASQEELCKFIKSGINYTLIKQTTPNQCTIKLLGKDNEEILEFKTGATFEGFFQFEPDKDYISAEEATFSKANEQTKITVVFQNLNLEKTPTQTLFEADVYILIRILKP
jgi:hypothetical protein